MLLIKYYVIHKNHPKEIELCGRFQNMAHFNRFCNVEAWRGWIVSNVKVIKEEKDEQARAD